MFQLNASNQPLSGANTDSQTQSGAVVAIPRIACDAGNRQLKFGQTIDNIRVVPSVVKALHPFDEPVPEPSSVAVTYVAGDNKFLVGQRWVVGALAAELGGQPAFKGEKADLIPQLALAAIAPAPGAGEPQTIAINELKLCLPDDRDSSKVEMLQIALRGWHQIERDGIAINLKIRSIIVEPEGASAFKWCKSQGIFRYAKLNGILDFGGGNTTGQLFSSSGMLLRESRITLPGAFQLAQNIAADPCLVGAESKGFSPRAELILDAIANGSLMYGTTGRSFASVFLSYRDAWLNSIRSELKTRWAQWLGEIGEVGMVGGSAMLAEPIVKSSNGRFKIVSEPSTCTARGMLL